MMQIESRQNAALKHIARLQRDKKYRLACGELVGEGEKLLYEAMQSGMRLQTVIMRDSGLDSLARAQCYQAEQQGARLYQTSPELFALACDAVTPQGVVFSCAVPEYDIAALHKAQRLLLLDGVQDPGNLGTILRTAEAFAIDAVILCAGTADFTAPKVVRATMGALFRQPIYRLPLAQAVEAARQAALPIYAAALTQEAVPIAQCACTSAAVIIGSEGHGVSQAALALCDKAVILPMAGRAESLNAGIAAAIFMWEMSKGG